MVGFILLLAMVGTIVIVMKDGSVSSKNNYNTDYGYSAGSSTPSKANVKGVRHYSTKHS